MGGEESQKGGVRGAQPSLVSPLVAHPDLGEPRKLQRRVWTKWPNIKQRVDLGLTPSERFPQPRASWPHRAFDLVLLSKVLQKQEHALPGVTCRAGKHGLRSQTSFQPRFLSLDNRGLAPTPTGCSQGQPRW